MKKMKIFIHQQKVTIIHYPFLFNKGHVPAHAFPVKINKEKLIDELKDVVKEKIDVPVAKDLEL